MWIVVDEKIVEFGFFMIIFYIWVFGEIISLLDVLILIVKSFKVVGSFTMVIQEMGDEIET